MFSAPKNIFILFFISSLIYAQSDLIPVENKVYSFLKRMQVQGVVPSYDDIVIPKSRNEIRRYLSLIEKSELTRIDLATVKYYLTTISNLSKDGLSATGEKRIHAGEHLASDNENYFYFYSDSLLNFSVQPILSWNYLTSNQENHKGATHYFTFGGKLKLNYKNFLSFNIEGWNGTQYGNRETAKLDRRIAQSFTFNDTELNNFDGTSGFVNFEKGIFSLRIARERVLWGNSSVNRATFSETPQLFDHAAMSIQYKSFRYDFIFGWLVMPTNSFFVNDTVGNIKRKPSKYIAVSRLGFNPGKRVKLGVTQKILFSNRPIEAAYFLPFIYWESAQRSMGDLDNSFLELDARWLITNGMELYANINFDDLNFDFYKSSEWNTIRNRMAWQAGFNFASPLLPDGMSAAVDYMQIRPFTFSHPEIGEALAYTNNGYPLGVNVQPNSTLFTFAVDYTFTPKITAQIRYDNYLHGANEYNENGEVIRNVGGSYFLSYNLLIPESAYLLDGILEVRNIYTLKFMYRFSYNLGIEFQFNHLREEIRNKRKQSNTFHLQLGYAFL
ncbi:MAG: hypothetical protein GXO87_07550 [Chlorobi bacterium]|nr:hypothetical protein [Chlorobiota bacterium]